MEGSLHFCSVSQPINTTVACTALDADDAKILCKCRNEIKRLQLEISELIKSLQAEFQLLDTFLYKNHNRFRNDKGYHTAKMLAKTLKKLLDLPHLEKTTDLLQFIPSHPGQQSVRLPTVAMSNYCQVLLTFAARFLQKIDRLCRKSGLLNMQRLNLGHFWGVAAVCLAIVSRIWVLARNLLRKLELCYSNLGTLTRFLPGVSLDYELPDHLFDLLDDELREAVEMKESSEPLYNSTEGVNVDEFLDIGEPVKRSLDVGIFAEETPAKRLKVETTANIETIPASDEKKDCLSGIHSIEGFKKFILEESDLRKTSKKTSFTRKLSQNQWKELKKEVLRNLNPVIPNKSIKLCRKMIRKSLKD